MPCVFCKGTGCSYCMDPCDYICNICKDRNHCTEDHECSNCGGNGHETDYGCIRVLAKRVKKLETALRDLCNECGKKFEDIL